MLTLLASSRSAPSFPLSLRYGFSNSWLEQSKKLTIRRPPSGPAEAKKYSSRPTRFTRIITRLNERDELFNPKLSLNKT